MKKKQKVSLKKNKLIFFETSACEGVNVDSAFMAVINEIFAISKGSSTTSLTTGKPTVTVTSDQKTTKDPNSCPC